MVIPTTGFSASASACQAPARVSARDTRHANRPPNAASFLGLAACASRSGRKGSRKRIRKPKLRRIFGRAKRLAKAESGLAVPGVLMSDIDRPALPKVNRCSVPTLPPFKRDDAVEYRDSEGR
ncbi:transposase [Rhizobium etli]|uniref:transposase n=1 Tax=Rhizobium etli TaxID=29449 RepID=UPI0016400CAB